MHPIKDWRSGWGACWSKEILLLTFDIKLSRLILNCMEWTPGQTRLFQKRLWLMENVAMNRTWRCCYPGLDTDWQCPLLRYFFSITEISKIKFTNCRHLEESFGTYPTWNWGWASIFLNYMELKWEVNCLFFWSTLRKKFSRKNLKAVQYKCVATYPSW